MGSEYACAVIDWDFTINFIVEKLCDVNYILKVRKFHYHVSFQKIPKYKQKNAG